MSTPLITTILVAHARPDSLKDAIKTVKAQTYENWQLLITVDTEPGITRDRIISIVNDEIKEDSRIQLIELSLPDQRSTPYGIAINKAMKHVKGEYISYLCDDDLLAKEYYEYFINTFEKYPEASVCYTGIFIVNPDRGTQSVNPANAIKKCGAFIVDHIAFMHKKEVLEKTGKWPEEFKYKKFGDAGFLIQIAEAGYKMYPTKEVTCIKRVMQDSLNVYNGGEPSDPEKKA